MMSKKKLAAVMVASLMVVGTLHAAVPTLQINGQTVTSAEPTLKEGRLYAPLRVISESLDASVEWPAVVKAADICKDGSSIKPYV